MKSLPELTGVRPLSVLGRGGTAEVVKVYSDRHRRDLALKYPLADHPDTRETFTRLAQREDTLIGGLRFPGLVRLVELSRRQPPYLLMELCEGPSLDQVGMIENLPLALNILSAIALNLEYLRANDIIHGDLKPQNIFLPRHWQRVTPGSLFFVRISDFSLGRFGHEAQGARAGAGTVGYMAPETIADSRTSFSSDLFAVGVTAYQVLTGRHPFMEDETDPVEVNSRIRENDPTPIVQLRHDVPDSVAELVTSLLAKQEKERPCSGWEVCQVLRSAGARYPFEKALRPGHFFRRGNARSDHVIDRAMQLDRRQSARLERLANNNEACRRLILSVNFIRGNLHYDGDRFVWREEIVWPAKLRRKVLCEFERLSFAGRRQVVRAAVVGDINTARQLGVIDASDPPDNHPALLDLVRQFISPKTVRRLSARYAPAAKQAGSFDLAARLYLQAGQLDAAARCAEQAALELSSRHSSHAAVMILNQVVEYADLLDRLPDVRQLLMAKGDIYKQGGDTEQALSAYQQIIGLYNKLTPDGLLAETHKDLGDLYRIRQDCARGLQELEKALDIYRDLHDDLEISHALNNMGNIHWMASNLGESLRCYRRALRIQRRLDARADTASTLGNIGSIYAITGRFGRSIHVMDLSLQLKKEIGNAGEIARSLNNLGYVYHLSSKPDRAVSCLSESLAINRRIGSKKEILYNLENLTALMITAGRIKESLPYLEEGMELSESLGDRPHTGVFNLSLGIVSKRMGRFSEAIRRFDAAQAVVDEIDDKMLGVQVVIQRSRLRHFLGDTEGALAIATTALTAAEKINDKSGQLNALLTITRVSPDESRVKQALALAEELHLERERLLVRLGAAAALMDHDKADEAFKIAGDVLPKIERISEDIELPWMLNLLTELQILHSDYDGAARLLSRAERFAGTNGLLPEMASTFTLKGRIELAREDYEECYRSYRQALQISKQISDCICDDTDRRLYQNRRSAQFLVSEIQKLAGLLGQKKGAGAMH